MAIACQGHNEVLLKDARKERKRIHLFGFIMRWLSGLEIRLHYPAKHQADNTASFAFRASIFPER